MTIFWCTWLTFSSSNDTVSSACRQSILNVSVIDVQNENWKWICQNNCHKNSWCLSLWWVDCRTTPGAAPARLASLHLPAHKHHLSPGDKPGNPPRLLDKSFPRDLVKDKKFLVIVAHTTWTPWSFSSVLQYPSLRISKTSFDDSYSRRVEH